MKNIYPFDKYFEKKWSSKVETDFKPKEGVFSRKKDESDSEMSNRVAAYLKKESKDLKQAMSRLNFYINRGGSNISKKDQTALNLAKEELRKKFNS